MRKKLLSLLVLLMTAVTGAWADSEYCFYLVVDPSDNTSATLMYGEHGSNPYHAGSGTWYNDIPGKVQSTIKTITADATTCGSFDGTSLKFLFCCFEKLTSVDLSGLSTSSVTNMSFMFEECTSLQTVTLSGWNTSSVQDMECMFRNCSSLETLDLSGLNTSSLTDMSGMLKGCSKLQTVNFSGWNTSKVTDMYNIFNGCTSLQTLDISSFNTGNVTVMQTMFNSCTNLTTIYVGAGWDVSGVNNSTNMFSGCTSLPNWDGTTDATHANDGADGYLNKMKLTAHEGETGEFWTTFYNEDKNFIAPTGTKVFKVALSETHLTMYEVEDRIVNSYMPVVLKSTGENIVMTVSASSAGDGNPNSLSGIAVPEGLTAGNPSAIYVLNNGSQGVGFYKLKSGKKVSAGKAYLYYSGGAGAREFFGFDESTGIENVSVNGGESFENGEVYDLQGRRISQPKKGLYIVNGKKVFINK